MFFLLSEFVINGLIVGLCQLRVLKQLVDQVGLKVVVAQLAPDALLVQDPLHHVPGLASPGQVLVVRQTKHHLSHALLWQLLELWFLVVSRLKQKIILIGR
jgi:hypothetical protein